MENDLKGNENYFELTGGSSYRGFELPGVDCNSKQNIFISRLANLRTPMLTCDGNLRLNSHFRLWS